MLPCIRYGIALLFCILQLPLAAQVDSILALPREEQQEAIYRIYYQYEWKPTERISVMQPLETAFGKKGRDDLEEMIWSLLWFDRLSTMQNRTTESDLKFFDDQILEAHLKSFSEAGMESRFRKGLYLFQRRRYSEGMEIMMANYEMLKRDGWSSPYAKCAQLEKLGLAYYQFGDYRTCMNYLFESLHSGLPTTSRGYPYKAINTIGLCYLQLHQMDSAAHYFTLSHDIAAIHKDSSWMALTTGNIGHALFKAGKPDEALPYLENDYHESIRFNNLGSAINASNLIATILLQKGQPVSAEKYLNFASVHLDTFLDQRLNHYENLFRYHKLKGEDQLAVQYADSTLALRAQKQQLQERKVLEQANMKAAYIEYDDRIKQLSAEHTHQRFFNRVYIGLAILAIIAGYVWLRRRQLRTRTVNEQREAARTTLRRYVQSLIEKTARVQALRQQSESSPTSDQVAQLAVLSEEEWAQINSLFDTGYPGFASGIKQKLRDLSPTDLRVLILSKLQVSQHDMCDLLGMSPDAIQKSSTRLRKKLNLPEGGSLTEVMDLSWR